MNNEFVLYKESLELKQIGFDEECFSRYVNGELLTYKEHNDDNYHWSNEISVPLIQQAFRWFRDTHKLYAEILVDRTMGPKFCYQIFCFNQNEFDWEDLTDRKEFFLEYFYEKAEYDCLKKLIEIVKNRNL